VRALDTDAPIAGLAAVEPRLVAAHEALTEGMWLLLLI
jgi:hypothetical protein